jgi:hypothetical protein
MQINKHHASKIDTGGGGNDWLWAVKHGEAAPRGQLLFDGRRCYCIVVGGDKGWGGGIRWWWQIWWARRQDGMSQWCLTAKGASGKLGGQIQRGTRCQCPQSAPCALGLAWERCLLYWAPKCVDLVLGPLMWAWETTGTPIALLGGVLGAPVEML